MLGPSVETHKSEAALETMGKIMETGKIPACETEVNTASENLKLQ